MNLDFDFVLLDQELGLWDDQSSWLGFQAISRGPAMPMARVNWNDFAAIGRLLDRGVAAVLAKGMFSAEEGAKRIAATLERSKRLGNDTQRKSRLAVASGLQPQVTKMQIVVSTVEAEA